MRRTLLILPSMRTTGDRKRRGDTAHRSKRLSKTSEQALLLALSVLVFVLMIWQQR